MLNCPSRFAVRLCCFAALTILVTACASTKSNNPQDPYEQLNRKTYRFNKAFDATMIRPLAQLYDATVTPPIKKGIGQFFMNLQMLPTVANDILQLRPVQAYKDSWRLFINSTFGLAGLLDVASGWGLPYHPNDFGLTLMHWGGTQSAYFIVPIWGPSTIRDAFAVTYDYFLFSVFPYISPESLLYGTLVLDAVDQRSQILNKEPLLDEALDEYTLVRDAYLQMRAHRYAALNGGSNTTDAATPQQGTAVPAIDGANAFGYVDE